MRKVIITGATGFLGKSFVRYLLEREVEIVAVVRDSRCFSDIEGTRFLKIVEASFSDYITLYKKIPCDEYDAFYHFAWSGTSGRKREDYQEQLINVGAACDAVNAAKILNCKKFINAGSLMEYECMKLMGDAESQPTGNYLYRSAKLAAHYMAGAEAGRIGIPFLNMIISNIYGAGEISGRFISNTLQRLLKKESVSFTTGTQLYDFINIKDAVEAFYMIGEYGKEFKDYYVGSNHIQPLAEYIREIYIALSLDELPDFGTIPFDGISLTYKEFDREALFRDTGFRCKVTFSEGIKEAYKWLKEETDAKIWVSGNGN